METTSFRTKVLSRHFLNQSHHPRSLQPSTCLHYSSPDLSESILFDTHKMRKLMDGHNWEDRDIMYNLMVRSELFGRKDRGGVVFACPDYNQSMEQQRVMTMRRIEYLKRHGAFDGFLTAKGPKNELRSFALADCYGVFDHSLGIKLGVHFFLCRNRLEVSIMDTCPSVPSSLCTYNIRLWPVTEAGSFFRGVRLILAITKFSCTVDKENGVPMMAAGQTIVDNKLKTLELACEKECILLLLRPQFFHLNYYTRHVYHEQNIALSVDDFFDNGDSIELCLVCHMSLMLCEC